MKTLLALILVALTSQALAQPRLVVIGDSLSAGPDSWPSYVEDYHVHLLTQGGRLAREYAPPRDIAVTNGETKLVYFLSTGDILRMSKHVETRSYVVAHIQLLNSRGFDVTLVIPPVFKLSKFNTVNHQHRQMLKNIKGVNHCDVNPWWDKALTYDGIHPVPQLSATLADVISDCLK